MVNKIRQIGVDDFALIEICFEHSCCIYFQDEAVIACRPCRDL